MQPLKVKSYDIEDNQRVNPAQKYISQLRKEQIFAQLCLWTIRTLLA